MSSEQVQAARDCPADLSAPAAAVLMLLASYADRDGSKVYPSVATLARQSRQDRRTVQRALAELISAGQVAVLAPGGGALATSYRLTITRRVLTPAAHRQGRPTDAGGGGTESHTRGNGASDPRHTAALPPDPKPHNHHPERTGAREAEATRPAPDPEQERRIAELRDAVLATRAPDPTRTTGTDPAVIELRRRQAAALAERLAADPKAKP